MNCPSCQSEDTQAIKMVLLSGTSTSKGKAIGIDSQGDIGVGSLSSNSRTNLAAKLDPGQAPTDPSGCMMFGCGGSILFVGVVLSMDKGDPAGLMFFGLPAAALIIYGLISKAKRDVTHSKEMAKWNEKKTYAEKAWICHRCGHHWLPK